MRQYEVMYIIRTDIENEVVQATVEKFKTLIGDQGGELTNVEALGKKRLAYEIDKFRDGHYVLMHFSGEPAVVAELERVMKISDEIIRYLITQAVAS